MHMHIYTTKNPYTHIYIYQRDEGSEKRWCFSCADTGIHMHIIYIRIYILLACICIHIYIRSMYTHILIYKFIYIYIYS